MNRSGFTDLLLGLCIGAANIIPGVSGGTFLLIFNLYERVFTALNTLNRTFFVTVAEHAARILIPPFHTSGIHDLRVFLRENDFFFLMRLIIGAGIAVAALSNLMKFLLIHHFSHTYSAFFGLILVSIIIPIKMIQSPKKRLAAFTVMGMAITVMLTLAVDPYTKAVKKSDMYKARVEQDRTVGPAVDASRHSQAHRRFLSFSSRYSAWEYGYITLCGAVAVSAMVLPGISGSLVLILMGQYYAVLEAISRLGRLNLDSVFFLSAFTAGMIAGLLLFSRLVAHVFRQYYDETVAFLVGLMGGSLYALWPFKKTFVIARQYIRADDAIVCIDNAVIHSNINVLPESLSELAVSLFFCFIGALLMAFFIRKDRHGT